LSFESVFFLTLVFCLPYSISAPSYNEFFVQESSSKEVSLFVKNPSLKIESAERVKRFQELLRKEKVDGALIIQKMAVFYLIGTDQDGLLWVPAGGEPFFMVRKSYERSLQDALIERILPLKSLSKVPELVREHNGKTPGRIGLELDVLPARIYLTFVELFPDAALADVSQLIRQVRMVKSEHEISLMRKAAALGDELFARVPGYIRESKTEIDLALRAEAFYRSKGHPGLSRMRAFNVDNVYGHVMAGASAAVPSASPGPTGGNGPGPFMSHGAGHSMIRPHEPILVDYTANVEGYITDQSRIYSLGDVDEKLRRAHEVMIEIQKVLVENGKPGASAARLYALALEISEEAGLSKGFMGFPLPVPFVGHGLGLELDEWPIIGKNSDHILQNGMVVALEPKVIFPGEGVVGIENTFLITERGMEKLSRFPDNIVVI
jgi:Xaa-Pro dipeptidase